MSHPERMGVVMIHHVELLLTESAALKLLSALRKAKLVHMRYEGQEVIYEMSGDIDINFRLITTDQVRGAS